MAITKLSKPARRASILAAAREVFLQDGYQRSRMEEVARRAHVGKGTLYEHFENKEDLFLSLCSHLIEENVGRVREALPRGRDPRRRLGLLLHGLVASLAEMTPLLGLYFEAWTLASSREDLRERCIQTFRRPYEPLRALLADLVRQGQEQGHFSRHVPEDTATVLLAAVDGLAYQTLFILETTKLRTLAPCVQRLFLAGLDLRP